MTDLEKKLSVLLDDHGGEANLHDAIDEAAGDVNLQYRVRRYRMIGEVMRNELPRRVDTDFHNSVMARVHAEAAPAPRVGQTRAESAAAAETAGSFFDWGWMKPAAGLALAAGVAVVTVSLWQPQPDPGTTVAANPVNQPINFPEQQPVPVVRASTNLQTPGTRWKIEDNPELQQKLNAYLVNHTEHSNSVQGLIPQARVAGFDTRQQ